MTNNKRPAKQKISKAANYNGLLKEISSLISEARSYTVKSVNSILTATYWHIGRMIIEHEQGGKHRAEYGKRVIEKLSADLTHKFGRGFTQRNIWNMRQFYLYWPALFDLKRHSLSAESSIEPILHSLSAELKTKKLPRLSAESSKLEILRTVSAKLSWTHYRRLLAVEDKNARDFYETEAMRGDWSVKQLDRQISTQFYERALLSKNKSQMLTKGSKPRKSDIVTPETEIKSPTILEFLNLKDEYSETDLEEALILKLEDFLLELGYGFTFVARQKRIKIGTEWYRIDLLLYHRKLQCLVVIDLKVGKFTHADAGQMNLYLNYVAENMTMEHEKKPVGLIMCADKDDTVVHYALDNLNNKILASKYMLQLPDEKKLKAELKRTQKELQFIRGER